MIEQSPDEPPVEPYMPPIKLQPDELAPDFAGIQGSIVDESSGSGRSVVKPVIASVATLFLAAGGIGYAAEHLGGDHDTVQETGQLPEAFCYAAAAEQSFDGNPKAQGDNPLGWTEGVLIDVALPQDDGYRGTRFGFRGPGDPPESTQWSGLVSGSELIPAGALMRTGRGDYTIDVENVAVNGSSVCAESTDATFTPTHVQDALDEGAIEPPF